jgi:signal transduction histidine kinase
LISGDRESSDGLLTSQLEELCEQWSQTSDFNIGLGVETAYDATVFERIPERVTRNLTLIVKEAISNAVRHSGGSTIDIRLNASGGLLRCAITDNGNGFPASHIVESGTLNLRSRAELLGGSARIESTKSGVTVDVTVPLPIEQV